MKPTNKTKSAFQIAKNYVTHFLKESKELNFFGICAQMSFYMMMVFFPLFIFLINFVGTFVEDSLIIDTLVAYMPDISADYVYDVLSSFHFDSPENHIVLLIFSFVFTVIGFRNIIRGLNHVHSKGRHTLSPWVLLLRSALFTLFFSMTVLVMIVAILFGNDIVKKVLTSFSLQLSLVTFISQNLFVLTSFLSLLLFSGIYYLVSIDRLSFKHTLPGAVLCTLGFNIGLKILIFFTNQSSQYIRVYGNFAGLFVLLVMIYWYAVLLNVGANMNAYYAHTYRRS